MANKYAEVKNKHQERVNKFPMKFFFSEKQFEEAMNGLGFTKDETDKVLSIPGGGIIRKTDAEAYEKMFEDIELEEKRNIEADKDGTGYIADMFEYELNNHEYGYTYNAEPAIEALGLTFEKIENNKALLNGYKIALKKIKEFQNLQ